MHCRKQKIIIYFATNFEIFFFFFQMHIKFLYIPIWDAYDTFCLFYVLALWNWSWDLWHVWVLDCLGCCFLAGLSWQWELYIEAAWWEEQQSRAAFQGFCSKNSVLLLLLLFMLLTPLYLIQFLGRDKDDGVRRSAVSGKKVLMWLFLVFFLSCYG